jgi:hypothetical protein
VAHKAQSINRDVITPCQEKPRFLKWTGAPGNPTAANLFNIIACLQEHEGVRLQVVV